MSITTPEELERMRQAGAVVRRVLEAMRQQVRPGVSTAELDAVGDHVMRRLGGRSAPALVYQFPGSSCISLNDEAVHGIPRDRALAEGDLVKLDVTVEKNGFMADAALSVAVGSVSPEKARLAACAERAFELGLQVAKAGTRVVEIGRIIEKHVRGEGFSVIRQLGGHGIGRTIHETPHVPNYADPDAYDVLTEGMVITIEPIIAAGSGRVMISDDGWTIRTADRRPSAHFEQTVMITSGEPVILTAA